MENRKYQFSWDLLGNIELGRPNLGRNVRLEAYRLMEYCFRDVMEQQLGVAKTDDLFRAAGKLAGAHFYRHMLGDISDYNEFIRRLQEALKNMGIGILRVEKADLQKGLLVVTVSEDLDCSGLPELDYGICTYDEGFISALLENFTGRKFVVKEVDCWCTGDRTCRFTAQAEQ